ncbi:MAG: DbpA RNA binding domain-containing protein [Gemmatimonadota bacterium]
MSRPVDALPPASLGEVMAQRGFAPDHPLAAVAFRGSNLVVSAPPAPAYAVPAIAGLLARVEPIPDLAAVVIVPEEAFEPWSRVTGSFGPSAARVVAARGPARATRHLTSGQCQVLLGTPGLIAELLRRGVVQPAALSAIMLVWPERWLLPELELAITSELNKDAQRIIVTADPAATAPLVERFAWKAPILGPLAANTVVAPAIGTARFVSTSWRDRVTTVARVIELVDPSPLTVWTADTSLHSELAGALESWNPSIVLAADGELPAAGTVICVDLPTPAQLAQVAGGVDLILLVPPGADGYVRQWVGSPRPLVLSDTLDIEDEKRAQDRTAIRAALISGPDRVGLAVLTPLFERYDPVAVAAALHGLWTAARRAAAPAAQVPATDGPKARVWVSAGRKDQATNNDFTALLNREHAWDRNRVGRIDVRETFTLIECTSENDAKKVVEALAGRSIGQRRLAARIDRGRPAK